MSILTVANVAKYYGADLLFSEINFSLAEGQKMGLIGRNGGGKTTLLRILLGQETPDASVVGPMNTVMPPKVSLAAGRRMGYLRQEAPVHPEHTLREEIEGALAPIRAVQARIADAEHAMADAADDAAVEKAMADYAAAHDQFEALGGYAVEAERDAVLLRLGFGPETLEKRVGACSGGEQTRLALAKLVLTRPDLLILDEPTNHLDIAATEWLEGFLKDYPGAVLLVSHDRYFLDAVTDTIAELEHGRLEVYKGNYAHYRRQKEDRQAAQQAAYEQQQAEIARLKDLIKRNMGADANASNIRHKTQGRIDRMVKIAPPARSDMQTVKARIDAAGAGRIGREVLRVTGLAKAYGDRTLFSGLDAVIERGDRVGLVGPNGAGKTTLLKLLLEEETPTAGTLAWGHNVRRAYFSQHATDDLDVTRTVLETLTDEATKLTETEARNYLGRFLFSGDDVYKSVSMLSGGEKNKLALARMLLEPCNLLILDEPTNHLDIASVETLTQMLAKYDGTLLVVSHDRYLLNAVTSKTLGLTGDGGARMVEGNYAAWRQSEDAAAAATHDSRPTPKPKVVTAADAPPPPPAASTMSARDLSKARVRAQAAVEKAEQAVAAREADLARVEAALAAPKAGTDLVALAAEHTRLQSDVNAAVAAWESAVAEQEALG
ncbi:MAG TPA: ATP-binding cassette domain-containing protein [Armatimonadaceae bacterium]|nr:ATP-binding cassette domain-containing protein [Armatimonadaceae bacterium]